MPEREIFLAILDLPPAARAEYLDKVCGADAAMRQRVDALLNSHLAAGSFLGAPAVAPHDPDSATTRTISPGGDAATDDEVPLGFLAPATRPDALGRIGHYEILQVLGQGAFGIVFRAFDNVLHRVVAVKVLSPQMAATSPARKRFLREARSSAQVRHDNVVQVYEVGEHPLPYIVMEFIPGETLQQRLNRTGPADVAEVVRIGRQIAEGLSAAHANDLIHRDIKPGNILLEGGAQRVRITDFGLARTADDASISQSGIIAGTPMYMAPEQAKGETLDQRADLFSLGSVLYQMAAGRSPFRANGTVAVLKRVAEDTPRNIREITPETPQWLCDIIAKLHAKDPDDRYQSAREVADVLADCEAQLKAHAKLKDFSRIPRGTSAAKRTGFLKRLVVAVLLLPIIVLLAAEVAGQTRLFRGQQETRDPSRPGIDPPLRATKPEHLPTYKNSIGMEFVIVPKGTSWLGGGKDKLGDNEVEIPSDFYLGKYVVTQEEWTQVMGENPSYFSRSGGGMDAVSDVNDAELKRFPVENVSWDRCQIFVEKLNAFEKEKGWVYRLPTEAEWEYACRGGPMSDKADSSFDFYFAKPTNTILPEQANFWHENCLKRTCKVGAYEPNVLGLYDMHGNVAQLCIDLYDPQAPEVSLRSSRGGGWHNVGFYCRAANRWMHPSSGRDNALGLRLARVPPGAPSPEAKTQLEIAPLRDVDTRRIAALAAAVQVEEVRKELMRRNPGFDGKFEHKIEDGVVTEFRIVTDHVTDISPIRVWSSLRVLDCGAPKANGQLADLSPLKGMDLTGLKQIVLYGTQVTDASLACFKDCRSVTELWLNHTQVGDAGLAYFKYCNTLTSLWLEGTRVTGAGLFYFKNCKSLTDLRLSGSQVGDAGLCHLKDCKSLKWLFLYDTKVTDAGLAYFQDCKSLTYIWLSSTRVTDAGLEYFKDCTDLTHLDFTDTQVSDAGLAYFKDCKSLTFLGLGDTQIADAGLANFKGICLKNLRINNTGVTDLSPLQGMPLEEIYLTPKNIVKGLEILRDMKSLKTIGIRGGAVWPAAEFWERFDKGEFKE